MSHNLLLPYLALILLGLFSSRAAADNFVIWTKEDGGLTVTEGKIVWTKGDGDNDLWTFKQTGKGATIQVVRGKWKGWYLTCDPEGKERAVTLSEKPTPGSYWKVGNKNSRPTFLTAARGKVEHWHVDRGEEVEKVKGQDGQMYRAFKVILAEKPKHIRHVTITVIAP